MGFGNNRARGPRQLCWISVLLVALASGGLPAAAADFEPCDGFASEDRADCGTISVLEDRSQPEGRRIELNIIVLRAAHADGSAPVFLLAGGPGQGGTDLVGIALQPYAAVRETRDFVLVDQRGTGKSNRLDCQSDIADNPQLAFGGLFDPEQIARCREEAGKHADPRLYGTLHVVADLEEVRAQLGYDKVVLWGGSGGTRTALEWLRQHPESVEAIAIDGVAPPFMLAPSGYARGCQIALDKVFADCAAQESCNTAYPRLREEFEQILHRFDNGPITTFVTKEDSQRVAVEMHRGDFGYAVRGILYNAGAIARLPQMIHQAAVDGDVSPFAQRYWQRSVNILPYLAMGVHWSVFGTEDVPFINPAEIDELTAGTFLGTYLIDQYAAACAAWQGQGTVPAGYHEPVRSNAPALILSGYYDPSTPASIANEVAQHLPNSRHIVVRNESHGAGFGCAREIVVEFLRSAALQGLGTPCEDVGPVVFEVP